jgi:hypothetical protein
VAGEVEEGEVFAAAADGRAGDELTAPRADAQAVGKIADDRGEVFEESSLAVG